ncbi:MAG: peptidoglycan-binding domain-containing protein [Dolichospermum sp.]|jgi:peptidoglycan hydrolase-like protein with peptidoglycan-binding domain
MSIGNLYKSYKSSMKVSHITSIPKFSANCCYCLLLLITTPLLISSSALVSIALPFKTAQSNPETKINRPLLKLGSQGERVTELQAALKILGFYTGDVNGTYQQGTAMAVYRFQQAAGLNPNSNVDNITWQRLFPSPANISSSPNTINSITNIPSQINNKPKINNPTIKRTNPANKIQPTPINQQIPGIQYTTEGWPILRLGMSGPEVIKLQKQLQNLGFLTGKIDGYFGLSTVTAVKSAQLRYGLEPDGVVGGGTWKVFVKRTSQ